MMIALMTTTEANQWLNYSIKGGGSGDFSGETATWLEICIRVYQLPETLSMHTHNTSSFKVPYQKKMTVPWGAYDG